MSAKAAHRAGAVGGRVAGDSPTHALTAGESAWLALLPCTLALLALIVVLGPPLGRAVFAPPGDSAFWSIYVNIKVVRPEPAEHARYVLALLGPLLVGGGAFVLAGRQLSAAVTATLVTLSQAALAAFAVVCVVATQTHVYPRPFSGVAFRKAVYFTPLTLLVAVAIALLVAAALHHRPTTARLAAVARETTAKRAAAIAVAVAFTLLWLLSAFNTDASIASVNHAVAVNLPFWLDESYSILNGQAPLVDFHAQYGHLWAYIGAGGMALLGTSVGVYACVMLAGTAGALAAVYATFRRVAGSSVAALALFVPFVATSFFMEAGPLENRYSPVNLFSLFPIRYAGPWVLLLLVVRRAGRRATSRPPVLLFTFAGLVLINNVEFGVPAFGATLVALAATDARWSPAGIARLAGSALAGLVGAAAIVSVLTLVVAGALPHFGMLTTYPRIYGSEGFGMLPMPTLGLHLVVYLTFAAALVVAVVRLVPGREDGDDPALTGALAWAGIFGLGAGAYFVGRSHPHVLIDLFSAWALALSFLLVVAVRAILRRDSRRPTIAEALLLVGFGIAVCSLAQTPTPWSQVDRLRDTQHRGQLASTAVRRVVGQLTSRGEPVAILLSDGHRIAYDLGITDVTPYANIESMMTRQQWTEMLAALRDAHGRRIILPRETLFEDESDMLQRAGFKPNREAADLGIVEYVAR